MSPRAWVLGGVVSGLATGVLVLGAVIAWAPGPTIPGGGPSPGASAATPGGATPGTSAPPASAPPGASASSTGAPAASTAASSGATKTVMHIGERAPILAVPQMGGGFIDLAQLRGRPAWVIFVTTTCTGCLEELARMNGFLARYSSAGLVVLAIDVKEAEGTVATFARRVPANFPFGLDLDGAAQREWDVLAMPVHFWVDREGVIRHAAPGIVGSAGMVHGLQQILPGVTVTP